jgi:alcohol dehydrogenase (cytochrome c)
MTRLRGAALILGVAVAAAALALAVPATRQRMQLVLLRATGKIPDLSWGELLRLLPPGNGTSVHDVVESRNPFVSIRNPFDQPADIAAGVESFHARCAVCHGGDAHGGTGPDLSRSDQYRRGLSDLALFRTITRGVPGTAMPAHAIPARAAWQLVAYLRQLSARSSSDSSGPLASSLDAHDVTFARLADAARDSANWLTYSGTLDGQRHSRLGQITRENVARLKVKWLFQLGGTGRIESSPLVVGNVMYLTAPPGEVRALDARTGALLWSYSRPMPGGLKFCCGLVNRGLALLGNTLYLGTMDAHLVALNASTGALEWDVTVAEYANGYSITSAPLAVDGKVVIGIAGGEHGIRGFLDAYDARTGRRAWRFQTIPEPGQPGHETWGGDAWRTGGAPTWMTGSYDAAAGLLYWAVGNPSPDYQGAVRPGDNLYSNSVLALEVETGRLRWYYQFTPHDEHDWDATEILVLADADVEGRPRKLLLQANRNGFYYVLDRETGAFLTAKAFVRQTWNDGFDSAGRPAIRAGSGPSRQGTLAFPGGEATNWWSPSYDARTGLFYVVALEQGAVFFNRPDPVPDQRGLIMGSFDEPASDRPAQMAVRALDATTGKLRWEYLPPVGRRRPPTGGLLSTAGGLVFGGVEARFFALDAASGAERWSMNTGGMIHAAPVTYLSEGRQHVTIAAGSTIITFVLEAR